MVGILNYQKEDEDRALDALEELVSNFQSDILEKDEQLDEVFSLENLEEM